MKLRLGLEIQNIREYGYDGFGKRKKRKSLGPVTLIAILSLLSLHSPNLLFFSSNRPACVGRGKGRWADDDWARGCVELMGRRYEVLWRVRRGAVKVNGEDRCGQGGLCFVLFFCERYYERWKKDDLF